MDTFLITSLSDSVCFVFVPHHAIPVNRRIFIFCLQTSAEFFVFILDIVLTDALGHACFFYTFMHIKAFHTVR